LRGASRRRGFPRPNWGVRRQRTPPRGCSLTSKTPFRSAETAPTGLPPQGGNPGGDAARDSRSRTDFWGRRVETSSWSDPGTGRCEKPSKGCRGSPSPLAVRCWTELPTARRLAQGGCPGEALELRLGGLLHPEPPHLGEEILGGRRRKREDLEGDTSPWETRVTARWKRREVTTDSSAEQGLEVGRSPGGQLTAKPGNG
jgi:hypothetical protein